MTTVTVRKGTKEDLPHVLELIKELALYEKALNQVSNSVSQMEIDGFGSNPVFSFFVAEKNNRIVGLSLYYFRYSTWKGKRLYLEDIIVTESERGFGLGKLLFEKTMEASVLENCTGMKWQVLNWNKPAINFYKKYKAKLDEEWVNCSLEREEIETLLTTNH
ncbi:MAG: GNAT family N-acetyltransferase [Bacteroidetes bacterium]|nr:GNAT family N-acetyltransferase [Bacteroidota bacterium]